MTERAYQGLLIFSTLGFSWLAMQAVHEWGHVLHAWMSGGEVVRVVLHPLTISRTDMGVNPHPQFVAWGGAIWGSLIPVLIWIIVRLSRRRHAYLFAFFAGFCVIANGAYLAGGVLMPVGDAADLLQHGAARWQLALFGCPAIILGLLLWNGLGKHFGLGVPRTPVDRRATLIVTFLFLILMLTELFLFNEPPKRGTLVP